MVWRLSWSSSQRLAFLARLGKHSPPTPTPAGRSRWALSLPHLRHAQHQSQHVEVRGSVHPSKGAGRWEAGRGGRAGLQSERSEGMRTGMRGSRWNRGIGAARDPRVQAPRHTAPPPSGSPVQSSASWVGAANAHDPPAPAPPPPRPPASCSPSPPLPHPAHLEQGVSQEEQPAAHAVHGGREAQVGVELDGGEGQAGAVLVGVCVCEGGRFASLRGWGGVRRGSAIQSQVTH